MFRSLTVFCIAMDCRIYFQIISVHYLKDLIKMCNVKPKNVHYFDICCLYNGYYLHDSHRNLAPCDNPAYASAYIVFSSQFCWPLPLSSHAYSLFNSPYINAVSVCCSLYCLNFQIGNLLFSLVIFFISRKQHNLNIVN